jgi:hypothetical protein
MCLGFVLMGVPEQCPKIVALLAESYNPHVRYGAAMAVGLACAGSGLKDAVAMLEPMLKVGGQARAAAACTHACAAWCPALRWPVLLLQHSHLVLSTAADA